VSDSIRACNDHQGFIVVHSDKEPCPVCELIRDNFRMRMQLLTGAKLANYQITTLPKCIRQIFIEISDCFHD
jgi:hypothetical protein